MVSEAITDRFSVKVAIDVVEASTSSGESAVPEVLQLSGELDIVHADNVRHLVFKSICDTPARVVIVDVSAVTFIDCVGLETLLSAHRWLDQRGRRLVLVNISAPVQRLLAILERGGWRDPLVPAAQSQTETDSVHAADEELQRHRRKSAQRLGESQNAQIVMAQALGLVMGFHGCDSGHAGALLSQVSRLHNIDVAELAASLVAIDYGCGEQSGHRNLDALMAQAVRTVLLTRVLPNDLPPKQYG